MSAELLIANIEPGVIQIARGAACVEIPLQRQENGQLAADTRQKIIETLRQQHHANASFFQRPVLCGVGARGISLRRLTVPAASQDKLAGLLRLQVENEFPVPPDQLAWGWQILGVASAPGGRQNDILLAALRRSALEEWTALFAEAGVPVSFTPAVLARFDVIAPPAAECVILDIGSRDSEWLTVAKSKPASIRALPWGAENINEAALPAPSGKPIYLTGPAAQNPAVRARLAELNGAPPQALLPLAGGDRPASVAALQRLASGQAARPALVLQSGNLQASRKLRLPRQRVALAAALLLVLLFFPYLEPLLFEGHLNERLTQLHTEESRFGVLDRELNFLQYLRKTQPPTLDLFNLIAQSAPGGTTFDSYNITRAGELSLRGKMGGGSQVTEFRNKLMDSGWFSSVAVDEQTIGPDRRASVRLTAQLKPSDLRRPLPAALADSKDGKPGKT